MSTLQVALLVVGVVLVVYAFSPPGRRLLRSLAGATGAQLDKAADAVDNADPLAVLNSQIRNAAEGGRNASSVVDTAAKQLESLERQIGDDLKEKTRLETRITAVLTNGDPNNTAKKYALDLERVEGSLKVNQGQLEMAQQTYDDNVKLVEKYERDVATARKDAEALGLQLAQSEGEKELYRMSAALKAKLSNSNFSDARRRVQEKIDANRGAARAARDLGRETRAEEADEELERNAKADAILARFNKPAADAK